MTTPSRRRAHGFFVTFEGTEGAGKSTLIRSLDLLLKSEGQATAVTREPGGNRVSERIRALILENPMNPWTELFLYEAARAEHLATVIEPALAEGRTVLCDRFADSSLAYQAHARGLPWSEVKRLNRAATRGRVPDLTVLLDIDPALGLRHARDPNRFEEEGVRFQKLVRQGFLKARAEQPKRWLTLKARSGTPEELAAAVLKEIRKRQTRRGQKHR